MTAPPANLTTREVADLLRLKERKIYDLVATGAIPCVRVTGKLLFPRDLIEAWLARNVEYKGGAETLREPPLVVGGSHDALLDWALAESGAGLPTKFGGSLDGLRRLARGEIALAGIHLAEADAPLGTAWNVEAARRHLAGAPVVLVEWARRRQGLIVAKGNPHGIAGIRDLKRRTVIARQREAGAFVLLERLVAASKLKMSDLRVSATAAMSEAEVAAAIADGKADTGLAIEAVARVYRLDFVPLVEERYDLLVWRRAFFEPPLQKLFALARAPQFAARARELGGYDVAGLGTVHYNGP